jgi:hypothetical protein
VIDFRSAPDVPGDVSVLGVPVYLGGEVGPGAELDADFLAERAFEGKCCAVPPPRW